MDRNDLRIIVGGADPRQKQRNRVFESAYATNSRLMGVVVLYIQWKPNPSEQNNREVYNFHQFFYVETGEIGIESYKSGFGDVNKEILAIEQAMIGGLGAQKVSLTEREAYILIKKFAELNKKYREDLPPGYDEYGFLLEQWIDFDEEEYERIFEKICAKTDGTYELINYFLIRYFAEDLEAIALLVTDKVLSSISFEISSDAMCMNKIDEHVDEFGNISWICESLVETNSMHRIIVSDISVYGGKITSFEIISNFTISNIETAMKLERPEFVTVFEIMSEESSIKSVLDKGYASALIRDTNMGRLYLTFNDNNDHLKKPLYRLNDDVKGMIYVTDEKQVVLAAYSLSRIRWLEKEIINYPFGIHLLPLAKYEFKEDVFYDFVKSESGDFVNYIEYVCDFDPDDDDD